jgi:hypothetical protein
LDQKYNVFLLMDTNGESHNVRLTLGNQKDQMAFVELNGVVPWSMWALLGATYFIGVNLQRTLQMVMAREELRSCSRITKEGWQIGQRRSTAVDNGCDGSTRAARAECCECQMDGSRSHANLEPFSTVD